MYFLFVKNLSPEQGSYILNAMSRLVLPIYIIGRESANKMHVAQNIKEILYS